MELNKCIKERRSVRSFLNKKVPMDLVLDCLDSARYAPSSGNVQNFKFIVIDDNTKIKKISSLCSKQEFISQSPVLIVVCAVLDKIKELYGSRGEALYSIQNCAIATQNLLLKAYDSNLSTCWIGDFDEVLLTKELEIKDFARPQAIICLGYSDEKNKPKRMPLDNFVFFNKYGKRERDTSFTPLGKYVRK